MEDARPGQAAIEDIGRAVSGRICVGEECAPSQRLHLAEERRRSSGSEADISVGAEAVLWVGCLEFAGVLSSEKISLS